MKKTYSSLGIVWMDLNTIDTEFYKKNVRSPLFYNIILVFGEIKQIRISKTEHFNVYFLYIYYILQIIICSKSKNLHILIIYTILIIIILLIFFSVIDSSLHNNIYTILIFFHVLLLQHHRVHACVLWFQSFSVWFLFRITPRTE